MNGAANRSHSLRWVCACLRDRVAPAPRLELGTCRL